MKLNSPLTLLLTSGAAVWPLAACLAEGVVPEGSAMSRDKALQQILVSPLEAGSGIGKGGWMLSSLDVRPAPASVPPKLGQSATLLAGQAEVAGAKGDFSISGSVPGQARLLGMWAYLAPGSNVDRLGFQIEDAEGESLLATAAADWQGWKWVEFDLQSAAVAQAYAQAGKNKKVDSPLKGVHIAWFARAKGPSSLAVDALVASVDLKGAAAASLGVAVAGSDVGEPGAPLATQQIVLTNFSSAQRTVRVEYVVQRDPALFSAAAPDPVYGSDLALGAKSWSEAEGKRLEEGSLTDGKEWTSASVPWGSHQEAVQTIDLGREHLITRLAYVAGDANWAWKIDFSASADGQNFAPIAGLQNVDAHGKWGAQVLEVPAPFRARFVRLRHHNGGAAVNQIAMPSSLSVYGGTAGEKWELPEVGETIAQGTLSQTIAPRSFRAAGIANAKPLAPGAYLIAARVRDDERTQLIYRHFMVMPAALGSVAGSRFGLNTADYTFAPWHRRLGVGWVRFENMKWPMISPAPNTYTFRGLAPWNLDHDKIVSAFRAQGISILPYLFQTPDYASSAPADSKRKDAYPPRDNAQVADFVFQTVARYGSRKHPAPELKTSDKLSGLNQISTFEIWNEPNLHDPGWSGWVGTNAQYNELLRAAAEAAKRADPSAQVTNGGFGGIDVAIANSLLTPYADGKKPLDFIDVLNVHFYSGRVAPELATNDPNADRSGKSEGVRTYEQDLQRLVSWRDTHKPGLPIWLTETGYDSAGPFGTNEAYQAAHLPRDIMLALASGIEKVFIFRDQGSSPSMFAASGVIRDDGSYKPSWFTYATLIRQLDGIQTGGLRLPYPDRNVRLYAFARGAETILAAWSVEGAGSLKLKLGQSTITDAFGGERQENIAGSLKLSMFPVYIKKFSSPAVQVLVAQARREAAARRAEQARLARLRAYLFDFGGLEDVGTLDLGDTRTFTPVLGTDVFSEARGFGFFPAAAGPSNSMHWISDPLDKDSVRMNPEHTFRLSARPGRYQLRAKINPQGPATFAIKGAVGGDKLIPIAHDGPPVEAEIEVGAEPLSISNSGYGDLFWLTLIEQPNPAQPSPAQPDAPR